MKNNNKDKIESIKTQIEMVRHNCYLINKIENPSFETQLIALSYDFAFNFIEPLPIELQIYAVKIYPNVVFLFKNPNNLVKIAAIKSFQTLTDNIGVPSEYYQEQIKRVKDSLLPEEFPCSD